MQLKTMNGILPYPVLAESCNMFCMPSSFPEWKAPNLLPHRVQICICKNDRRTMICVKCKYLQEYTVEELRAHYQEKHSSDIPAFVCSKCGFVAVETQQVNMPELSCLQNKYSDSNNANYNYMNSENYYSHMNSGNYYSHLNNGDYRAGRCNCDKCMFTTKDSLQYKRHILEQDEIKFTCSYCNHVSCTRGEFQRHLVIHTGTFPHKCGYCDYGAVRNDYVMKHIKRVHEAMQTKMQMGINTSDKHNLVEQKSKSPVSQKQKIMHEEQRGIFPCDSEYMKTLTPEGKINLGTNNGSLPVKDSVQVEIVGPLDKVQPGMPLTVVAPSELVVPANCFAQLVELKTVNGSQQLVLKFIPHEDTDHGKGTSGPWNAEEYLTRKEDSSMGCSICPDGPFSNTFTKANLESEAETLVSKSEHKHNFSSDQNMDAFKSNASTKYVQKSVLSKISERPVCSFFDADVGSEKTAMLITQNPTSSNPKLINLTRNNSGLEISLPKKDASMPCIPHSPEISEMPVLSSSLSKNGEAEAHAVRAVLRKQREYLSSVEPQQVKVNLNKGRCLSPFNTAAETQESSKPTLYSEHSVTERLDSHPANENCTVSEGPVILSVFSLSSASNSAPSEISWNQNMSMKEPQMSSKDQNSKPSTFHGVQVNSIESKCQGLENPFQPTQNTDCCLGGCPELLNGRKRLPTDVYQSLEQRICNLKEKLSHSFIIPSFARRTSDPLMYQSSQERTNLTTTTHLPASPLVMESSVGVSNNKINETCSGHSQLQSDVNLNCSNSTKRQQKIPSVESDLKSSFVSNSFKRGTGVAQYFENALRQKSIALPDSLASMDGACHPLVGSSVPEVSDSVYKPSSELWKSKTATASPVLCEQQFSALFVKNSASRDLGCNAQKPDAGLSTSRSPKRVHFGSVSVSCFENEKGKRVLNSEKKVSDKRVSFKVTVPILKVKGSSKACEKSATVSPETCFNMDEIAGKQWMPLDAAMTVDAPTVYSSSVSDCTKRNLPGQFCYNKNATVPSLNENEDPRNLHFCPSAANCIIRNNSMNDFEKPLMNTSALQTNTAVIIQTDITDVEMLPSARKNKKFKEGNNFHVAAPVFIPKGTVLKVLGPNKTAQVQSRKCGALLADAVNEPEIFLPRPVPCSPAATEKSVNSFQKREMLDKPRLINKVFSKDVKHSIVDPFLANGKTARISVEMQHNISCKNANIDVNQKRKNESSLTVNLDQYPFWQKVFKPNIQMTSSFLKARHLKLRSPVQNRASACPYQTQPLVVLNHPDVDTLEITNVMKTIKNYRNNIVKVFLTEKTIHRLCLKLQNRKRLLYRCCKSISVLHGHHVLKMKLKKTHKNAYHIVESVRNDSNKQAFPCWFCGRVYFNQEEWISHGQRHLREATRNWNVLPKLNK